MERLKLSKDIQIELEAFLFRVYEKVGVAILGGSWQMFECVWIPMIFFLSGTVPSPHSPPFFPSC